MIGIKSKRILIAICLLASLLVGSASACACTHHAAESERVETESSSCHSHTKNTEELHEADANSFAGSDSCICVANGQRTAAKSEAVKLEKLAATLATADLPVITTRERQPAASTTFVEKPFYLSDPFYNLAPKRGPPRA